MSRETFEAIGTIWRIDLPELAPERRTEIRVAIDVRIAKFDEAYSRFRDDSLVMRMAQTPGAYELPADAALMMALYQEFYSLTGGRMTPLVGGLLEDTGYDARYSLQERPEGLRRTPGWNEALSYSEGQLTMHVPTVLDFGAIGKGYLVDLVAEVIERYGVTDYVVDAGGDIRHRGATHLRVGLEHPGDVTQAIGVAELGDMSLCGSAGNRRAWNGRHHIMDPHTQTSPMDLVAVWALADTTRLADGLTTALYFAKPTLLRSVFEFEYAMMYQDGRLEHSANFPAEFFIKESA